MPEHEYIIIDEDGTELTPEEQEEKEREARLAEARKRGVPKGAFGRFMHRYGRTALNTLMVLMLAGIALGWLLHSALTAVICMVMILVCIVLSYIFC